MSKVIIALSGGVDSSVAAYLLKQQGYQVEGVFMKNWHDTPYDGGVCVWQQDVEDAIHVCDKLAIPLNTVDLASDYLEQVFSQFLHEYKNGRTPNPDILCNQKIKFQSFLQYAVKQNADKIATGHYAQIRQDHVCQLLKGCDGMKDQSYFLCRLNQSQLNKSLFPVGAMTKSAVRQIAQQAGLITHDKKDSTGICFIGEQSMKQFLQRYIPPVQGLIKTTDGVTIGDHEGVFYYTLGQRRGLGIGGVRGFAEAPWYVINKDLQSNTLTVSQDREHPMLYTQSLLAIEVNWIADIPPQMPLRCHAKIRYRQPDQACLIEQTDKNADCLVYFDKPQWAVASGQYIVFYDGHTCLGSGIIRND